MKVYKLLKGWILLRPEDNLRVYLRRAGCCRFIGAGLQTSRAITQQKNKTTASDAHEPVCRSALLMRAKCHPAQTQQGGRKQWRLGFDLIFLSGSASAADWPDRDEQTSAVPCSPGRCLPPEVRSPPRSAPRRRLTPNHPPGSSRPAALSSLLPWRTVTRLNFYVFKEKEKEQQL